jgi:hypothetical protein
VSDKRDDADWRRRAEEEKARLAAAAAEVRKEEAAAEQPLPPPDFVEFLAGLELEARRALASDLRGARYVIDVLSLLQEKTKGNLDSKETLALQNVLTDLRFRYVEASKAA